MRVLVILAHPREDSLCAALAEHLQMGLREGGVAHQELRLCRLAFDVHVREHSPASQSLEPDLAVARKLIDWADHLVFIYPTWWGTYPALLKGFFDRILVPGYAFLHRDDGRWEPLLTRKTAELITTMDTPRWVYRVIYRAPGHNAIAAATLGFCGLRTVHRQSFAPVITSTAADRATWLATVRARGRALADGILTTRRRRLDLIVAWVAACRLQFYPLTVMAYSLGAVAAAAGAPFARLPYWGGLAAILLMEAATVFWNEVFDYDSDRRNQNAGPFNGGSRVLVDGRLAAGALGTGALVALSCAATLLAIVFAAENVSVDAIATIAAFGVLAVGYTVPPLKLSHRGAGELDVALTHSIGVLLPGFVLQGGTLSDPLPWLLALPLGISILPAITLAGLPDHDADRAAGKGTLVVRLGRRRALVLAMATTGASALTTTVWSYFDSVSDVYRLVAVFAVPHAAILLWCLKRRLAAADSIARVDGLIALALSYVLWFAVVPLWSLNR